MNVLHSIASFLTSFPYTGVGQLVNLEVLLN